MLVCLFQLVVFVNSIFIKCLLFSYCFLEKKAQINCEFTHEI